MAPQANDCCLSDTAKTFNKIAYLEIDARPFTAGQPLLLQAEHSLPWGAHSEPVSDFCLHLRQIIIPAAELRAAHLRVG